MGMKHAKSSVGLSLRADYRGNFLNLQKTPADKIKSSLQYLN